MTTHDYGFVVILQGVVRLYQRHKRIHMKKYTIFHICLNFRLTFKCLTSLSEQGSSRRIKVMYT